MIEQEAVIEPEPAGGTHPHRGRRAFIAGVTVLALVAGVVAVVAGGGGSEPKPLALMAGSIAGDSAAGRNETASATPAVAPAMGAPADSRLAYPYGGWGLKFEVAGDLPDLPDHAPIWRATGPALDRTAVARIAGALGLTGTPVQRDGGWFVEGGDWSLNAFPGGDTWSVNVFRGRTAGQADDAAAEPPAGPSISVAEAEARVRDLLDRMGAPAGSWKVETTETEIGVGWACASPAPAISPEEMRKLEQEKLRQIDQPNAAASDSVSSCPPPPAPVKGFSVALYPRLDGRRADWPVWQATLRSDGRIESLYGSWVTFERGDSYKLRGVSAALEDLQSPVQPMVAGAEGGTVESPAVEYPAVDSPAVDLPASSPTAGSGASGSTGSAPSRLPTDRGAATPAIEPAPCFPVATPLPADDKATSVAPAPGCVPPAPQVVTITGVELGLIQASVFEDGKARIALVPSYRFVGRNDHGSAWETSVMALHPDAIAPPPDVPVTDDVRSGGTGGGATGTGKAVPPTPPGAEPAIAGEPDPAK